MRRGKPKIKAKKNARSTFGAAGKVFLIVNVTILQQATAVLLCFSRGSFED